MGIPCIGSDIYGLSDSFIDEETGLKIPKDNLEELYNIVELLRPGYLGTWNQFKDKYAFSKDARSLNPIYRDQLQDILSKIIIRTTRKEVSNYIKFTDRIPHTNILEPSENEKKLYDEITDVVRSLYS